jgi:uncharacterized protein YoxC
MELTKDLYEAIIAIIDERVKEIRVGREEFEELRKVVAELARRMDQLAQRMDQLTQRVDQLTQRMDQLTQRVDQLTQRMDQLTQRVDQLTQRMDQLTQRVDQLTQRMDQLAQTVQELTKQVGALSENVGFGLEDIARVMLPGYMLRHLKIHIPEPERRFFKVNGAEVEMNLYAVGYKGRGKKGKRVTLVGECKSRIYFADVEKFALELEKIKTQLDGEVIPVLFGYFIHPSGSELARIKKILLVASYQR